MREHIDNILHEISKLDSEYDVNNLKSKYLGKNGIISSLMSKMKELDIEEKKVYGKNVNELKIQIENIINTKLEELENQKILNRLSNETIDITLPGFDFGIGTLHPLTQTIISLENLFLKMGFNVAEGPEIETDEYCFEKLNLPKHHPARDMQDTFYINPELLLRTQTSPVQVREMLKNQGKPLAIICPGKTYRRDADDATHSHQFMQCEGLVLGENISFSNLKYALLSMVKLFLGDDRKIRLRPSYFPFTEPSVEVDVTCIKCNGSGCSMCKNTGYIEILGAGMVNHNVLEMCGYDSSKIQGYAFGVGIERITMLKYGIEDIRNFYTNDVRFLKQFRELKI